MVFIAGVDEAGRGPLIGDLFMALVVIDERAEPTLRALGIRDSKKLSKNRREKLFGYIVRIAETVVVSRIPPELIDKENLNILEIRALCRAISKAASIVKIDKVYIDAFAEPTKLRDSVRKCVEDLDHEGVVVIHGADALYTVVGAASIIAKVLRDRYIDSLKTLYGDFGSGYPSDKRTIDWLKSYYATHRSIPPIVRRSWKTVDKVLSGKYTLDKYISRKDQKTVDSV
uniref:Ribonuclease HII n=1 Tax=Ignisphaera aggregans TaxID=334771 RepID=A0A7C2Z1J6_9CREN